MSNEKNVHSLIILGAGPAGLAAAVYAARANLRPLVITGPEPGGELMLTTEVENYPGFPEGILGPELMERFRKQAERFGAEVVYENVTSVDFSKQPLLIRVNGGKEYQGKSVIISLGSKPRLLGLESEKRLRGKGVSACATCDGAFFRGKIVAVIGGGDSAMEEATHLTRFASRVIVIHRSDAFRASKIMLERAKKNEKIAFEMNQNVIEIFGEEKVAGVKTKNAQTGEEKIIACDGVFLAIGRIPNTELFKGILDLNEQGYIQTTNEVKTKIPGVFVAGDVADYRYRQAITAAASGCKAALDAARFLEEKE